MTGTSRAASHSALMVVVVRAGERSMDCEVGAHVPVVEVVPGLARALGLLDPHRVHLGLRLTTVDHTVLSAQISLTEQGVRHGDMLMLGPTDGDSAAVYDDLADAVADVVDAQSLESAPRLRHRVALGWCAVFACATTTGLIEEATSSHVAPPDTANSVLIAAPFLPAMVVMVVLLCFGKDAASASRSRSPRRSMFFRRRQRSARADDQPT